MEITIWDLLIDFGLISFLLIIGILLKAKIKWIQKTFMPASFIAGLLGLVFGPNGFNLLPFSNLLGSYPELLIAVVFAAIPIGAVSREGNQKAASRIRNMWMYGVFVLMGLYAVGMILTQVALEPLMNLPLGAGMMLGVGFFGGHGSAAAIGDTFANLGWEEATSLGYTSATVGMLVSILIGMILIKRGTENNDAKFMSSFKDLPNSLKSGLVPEGKRKSMGDVTLSPNAIDPLLAHMAILGVTVLIAYGVKTGIEYFFPMLSLPLFSFAILVAILVQSVLRATDTHSYVDKRVIDRVSGVSTDLIVVFGISSINLNMVASYAVPLTILFIVGFVFVLASFIILAPRTFKEDWFENAIFNWGYSTGTVAMGIALHKIVDPDMRTTTLDDYGVAYLGIVPFEVLTLTFLPLIIMSGFGWIYALFAVVVCVALIVVSRKFGWITKRKPVS